MDDAFENAVEAYMRIGTINEKETDKAVVDIYVGTKCIDHDMIREAIKKEAENRKNK